MIKTQPSNDFISFTEIVRFQTFQFTYQIITTTKEYFSLSSLLLFLKKTDKSHKHSQN